MSRPARRRIAMLLVAAWLAPRSDAADAEAERRAKAGLKIFPSLLAADSGLLDKALPSGSLLLVILHTGDRSWADELAATLESAAEGGDGRRTIRDRPVEVEVSTDFSLAFTGDRSVAGVFVAEAPSERDLRAVIEWGIAHRAIVFSPFEGHVERGVLGGISIGVRVEPVINGKTLASSGIAIKEFYKKVARIID